ncbi:hypothetical protein BATDEDRAFT_21590 [Batrachochytrium dendrobatidis JAM81]|uniref:Glycosyltransferase family 28 N-terminal domain-containing protein n=1 Tax=Batrachochytrium dendrobatidis (strain JAM81 / FGSC 10211) TaxID=684364 RepID=F4NU18_BATDJ|nr:uncharacterized protein BATDEDRAFT_21590 [Batrachochytrium dendrobatidis JAM81]EGF83969.1 hypothetical protein BATDEDRAFT_21590 [Batrachochytrium dendrobatidis JAM81]KAK5671690.1 hypothetical protein QVD99_001530 [Batrachochytrium dendrobatidis]|eukprot:XP_006675328.1 hypothetical protein BATDEDRAFT_21590 [Batrachochytrium dendrobatidis JAM81]
MDIYTKCIKPPSDTTIVLIYALGSLGDAISLYTLAVHLAHRSLDKNCTHDLKWSSCNRHFDPHLCICHSGHDSRSEPTTATRLSDKKLLICFMTSDSVCNNLLILCGSHTCVQLFPISDLCRGLLPEETDMSFAARQHQHERSSMIRMAKIFRPINPISTDTSTPINEPLSPMFILFNLFSIGAWSIAEALDVPCIGISPFNPKTTVSTPSNFLEELSTCRPFLTRQIMLQSMNDRVQTHPILNQHFNCSIHIHPIKVAELEFWMWRLFVDDHDDFRQELGLDYPPFAKLCDKLNGNLKTMIPATPLLLLQNDMLSSKVNLPASVISTGFIQPLSQCSLALQACQGYADISEWCKKTLTKGTLIINFGSMEMHSKEFNDYATVQHLIKCIEYALQSLKCRAIWISCTENHLLNACFLERSSKSNYEYPIYNYSHALPLECITDLVQKYGADNGPHYYPNTTNNKSQIPVAVLHHGGVGTFQHCLSLGLVQLIMPQGFDQHESLYCGIQNSVARGVEASMSELEWKAAIHWALLKDQSLIAKQLQSLMDSKEKMGVDGTVQLIWDWMFRSHDLPDFACDEVSNQ